MSLGWAGVNILVGNFRGKQLGYEHRRLYLVGHISIGTSMHWVDRCHQRLCRHTPEEHAELCEIYSRLTLAKSGPLDDGYDEEGPEERLAELVAEGLTEHAGGEGTLAGIDLPIGYMGTEDSPKLLKDIRPAALARWKAVLARGGAPSGKLCRCGHTRPWHDFYHQREDGKWEVCWCRDGADDFPSGACGLKERCDVCDCMEFTAVQEQPART